MHLKNIEKNNDLTIMKDYDLLTRFSWVVQKEREAIAAVVSYLSEIERRKLYLKEAYSSLFSFVTQKFHYSEGAAYRRIQASKASQLYPEVLELLSAGKVSLMTLSLIEPHLTKEKGKEWIEKIIGKSKREVEFMLSELSLKKKSHRDIIRRLPVFRVKEEGELKDSQNNREDHLILSKEEKRGSDLGQEKLPAPIKGGLQFLLPSVAAETAQSYTTTGESSQSFTSETSVTHPHTSLNKENATPSVRKIKIEFVAKEELAQKIERAKEILRHKFPEGRFEDIFNQALEDMLEKRDPQRKPKRKKDQLTKKSEKASEHGEKMKEDDKDIGRKEVGGESGLVIRKEEGKGKDRTPQGSRYIPQGIRKKIWVRDGGQCSYESTDGRRCGERNFIQIDHAQPFALWGESTEENLRLLCARHNQWRSEKTFGKWG